MLDLHTFSIVARDPAGAFGVAVATARPSVGSLVPFVSPAGAIATQARVNTELGRRGLALLEQGVPIQTALRALLAERQVVLATAALVRIAFNLDLPTGVGRQVLAVRLDERLVFALDQKAVEIKIHALFRQRVVGIGKGIDAARRCRVHRRHGAGVGRALVGGTRIDYRRRLLLIIELHR